MTTLCEFCKKQKSYNGERGCVNTRDAEDFAIEGDLDCLEFIITHNAGEKGARYVILNYINRLRRQKATEGNKEVL